MSLSRCNKKECFVTGYTVSVVSGANDTMIYTMVDSCGTLNDPARIKRILLRAYFDHLRDEDLPVPSGCSEDDCCGCEGVTTYTHSLKRLVVTNDEFTEITTPIEVFVPLRMTEANVFD